MAEREAGSAAAEFAVAIPAVVLVLGLALSALQLGAERLRLQDGTALAARAVARGEAPESAAARLAREVAGATVGFESRGELVCATARVHPAAGLGALAGLLSGLTISVSSCTLGGGR